MGTPSLEILAERVERLERENTWLKRVGGGSIVGFLALIALGTTAFRAPHEISAERFVLRDTQGRPRAKLEMQPEGPSFNLLTRDGRDQVRLCTTHTGSSILEFVQGADVRAALSYYPHIGPSLNLFDRNRRSRAEMFVSLDGSSGMAVHRYQRSVGLNLDPDGTSKLSFLDHSGVERAGLGLGLDGRALSLDKTASQSIGLEGSGHHRPTNPPQSPKPGQDCPATPPGAPITGGGTSSRHAFSSP